MKQNNEQFLMWKMSRLLDEQSMWPERERERERAQKKKWKGWIIYGGRSFLDVHIYLKIQNVHLTSVFVIRISLSLCKCTCNCYIFVHHLSICTNINLIINLYIYPSVSISISYNLSINQNWSSIWYFHLSLPFLL